MINRTRHSTSKFRIDDMMMLNSKHIKIIKFNNFLNYKNFDFFKIIRAINNTTYELKLFDSIKNIFSIFHSWFLYLNNNVSLNEQIQKLSKFINIIKKNEWFVDEIVNFKIKNRRNNFVTYEKNCLQYRIKFVDDKNEIKIQRRKWQNYTNAKNVSYLIVDFHHKYSNRFELHVTFIRFNDWILLKKQNQ